jgi:hypothetical protein
VTWTKRQIERSNYFFDKLDAEYKERMRKHRKPPYPYSLDPDDTWTQKQRRDHVARQQKAIEKWVDNPKRKRGKLTALYAVSVDADAQLTRRKGRWKVKGVTVTLSRLERVRPRKR